MAISSAAMTLSLHYTPTVPNRTSLSSSFFTNNTFKPLTLAHGSMNNKKKRSFSCNCLFGLGVPELVVIAGVAALVFGPKKLPEVGRSIGKTVKSFQQAAKEFETELKKEPETLGESSDATAVNEQEPEESKVPTTKDSL
ncbi:putative sec-independent protein translocase protein TatA/B/E [Helianthus annuus]|uniref:Putative sec-independent protein translocase protein TATA protein n=1 Tax=Helianthus annuus TaxID=4232 RepID=A0A251UTM5_HELAN|nr:sec-independent protein translocase protein TATA, chloroplastic [Helianthus annuus]KAF5798161.1 putative sec-independent protein translocase protein TatA/B/E [Helianthus annuus]KAJ0549796.1 putative sec-independent protein translocase protein TatA/B/E [Helianthus annuus]KAJ0556306.1 putative sec-independent protein translocase protein TatA/B/E [Helianthus annuus]KAJ0562750.1 putative sec-independent protein translocase protein TatA/B/E [Helianthus annuus]KAJ0730899.1 putative sec-independen